MLDVQVQQNVEETLDTSAGVKQVSNPFAEVMLEKVQVAGQEVPQMAVMLRGDTGKPVFVASHSPDYLLVPNERASTIAMDAMTRSGLQYRPVDRVWNGKKFLERWRTQQSFPFDKGEVNLGIQVINSYDGSTTFGLSFFALYSQCLNQYHFGNLLGRFSFRHTHQSGLDMEDAIEQLAQAADRFGRLVPLLHDMRQAKLNLEQFAKHHEKLCGLKAGRWPISKTGELLNTLSKEEKTLWGLSSAITHVTTHKIGGISGVRISTAACDYLSSEEAFNQ